jgi:hypothetical protein
VTLLRAAVAHWRARQTPFALIGAAALAVHGVSRSTRDLDVLVAGAECLAAAYWEPLRAAGAVVDIRRGDEDDPLAGVVRLRVGAEPPLDVIVGKSAWQAGVLARAQEASLEGDPVPVVRRVDLILLKLFAGGPQDAWDIEQLLAVPERPALEREVEQQLAALPEACRRLWARIRGG